MRLSLRLLPRYVREEAHAERRARVARERALRADRRAAMDARLRSWSAMDATADYLETVWQRERGDGRRG